MGKKTKRSLISIIFTVIVIGILILSGPVKAIDVDLITPDVDLSVEDPEDVEFIIQINVNDGEFLPLMYTDLILDYGDDSLTCRINEDNTIDNCDFLSVTSKEIEDLYGGYGQGYGYGYGYQAPNYGYGYDFGYGYGYGYSGENGYGTITYIITVDVSEIPVEFLNNEIDVEAKVYGGTENNYRYFVGSSSFDVNAKTETPIDPLIGGTVTYSNSVSMNIPANSLPSDATLVIIQQVAPTANPLNTNFKILGKVYDFDIDSLTKTFSNNIEITITYTDEELTESGITDESKIYPAFYNTATGDWEQLTVLSRDPANNKLTFLTNHFTQFALLADTSTPGAPSTPSGGGGGGGRGPTIGAIAGGAVTPPTPTPSEEPEEETPTEEPTTPVTPTTTLPEEPTTPRGLGAITGAIIGALGTAGSIIVLIFVLAGVGTGGYFFFRKKK